MTYHDRIQMPSASAASAASDLAASAAAAQMGLRRFGGAIDVSQNGATKAMVTFFGALGVAVIVALWFGRFAKHETVRGFVSTPAGLTRIFVPKAGLVSHLHVHEGDIVSEGQVIISVTPGQISSGGATMTEVERRGLLRRRDSVADEIARIDEFAKRISLDQRMVRIDAEAVLTAIARQEVTIKEALASEEDRASKVRTLVQQNYATRDRLDGHLRIVRDLQRQLADVEVRRTQTRREETERLNGIDTLINGKTNARTQFESELADIEARLDFNRAGSRLEIRATRAGRLAALPIVAGSTVGENQFVAAIVDPAAEELLIRLSAPSSAIGLVTPGQRVVLKYDAFPFKTFGVQHGVIQSVASAPSEDPEIALAASQNPQAAAMSGAAGSMVPAAMEAKFGPRQSYFLVTVKPEATSIKAYGVDRPIQLGSTLTADVIVERRRLIDWVLDPILAMRGRT